MHHSRAEYLHPACALAAGTTRAVAKLAFDIHLGRGLREREVARTEASLRLAEEPVGEVGQRRLEIDKAHSFIDSQSFDLREHRRVRSVEEIPAVRVTGAQNSDRRLELLHRADLDRGRVSSEH